MPTVSVGVSFAWKRRWVNALGRGRASPPPLSGASAGPGGARERRAAGDRTHTLFLHARGRPQRKEALKCGQASVLLCCEHRAAVGKELPSAGGWREDRPPGRPRSRHPGCLW